MTKPNSFARALASAVLALAFAAVVGPARAQESAEPPPPATPAQGPGHVGGPMIRNPAQVLADRIELALGGREAWEKTRYLSFGFAGRRMHWWDRYTGRHRLEGTNREGKKYLVLENVNDQGTKGRAWIDGKPAEGEQLAELVENAYAAWINDTYWLLAPYKIRDPGVKLSHAGSEAVDGVAYEKLMLEFEGVGLTPGDRYWMYVNPETSLVDRWAYVLEGQEPPPTMWEWRGWKTMRTGIVLAPQRIQVGGDGEQTGGRELSLAPIAVPEEMPDAVFDSPEPVP